jgi:hypothetical protein
MVCISYLFFAAMASSDEIMLLLYCDSWYGTTSPPAGVIKNPVLSLLFVLC